MYLLWNKKGKSNDLPKGSICLPSLQTLQMYSTWLTDISLLDVAKDNDLTVVPPNIITIENLLCQRTHHVTDEEQSQMFWKEIDLALILPPETLNKRAIMWTEWYQYLVRSLQSISCADISRSQDRNIQDKTLEGYRPAGRLLQTNKTFPEKLLKKPLKTDYYWGWESFDLPGLDWRECSSQIDILLSIYMSCGTEILTFYLTTSVSAIEPGFTRCDLPWNQPDRVISPFSKVPPNTMLDQVGTCEHHV